jgi:hypothetical protein
MSTVVALAGWPIACTKTAAVAHVDGAEAKNSRATYSKPPYFNQPPSSYPALKQREAGQKNRLPLLLLQQRGRNREAKQGSGWDRYVVEARL